MTDKIKEILKEIECYQNEDMCLILLSQKENKALLDYITNLQQENERLKKDVELFKSDLISSTNTGLSLITKIDKAIEEINYWGIDKEHNDDSAMRCALNNLLNILQNGSDDNERKRNV